MPTLQPEWLQQTAGLMTPDVLQALMASNAGGDQHTAALLAALNTTTGTVPEMPVPAAKV